MYSCSTAKNSNGGKSDEKKMDTVINETIQNLKDSGIIR
jgi:hypothetical protein